MVPMRQIKCPSCGGLFRPDNNTGTTCPDCDTHIRTPLPPRGKILRLALLTLALAIVAAYLILITGVFSPPVYARVQQRDADGKMVTRLITDEQDARQQIRLNRALAVSGYSEKVGEDADRMERAITHANRAKSAARISFALFAITAVGLMPALGRMVYLRRKNLLVIHCPSCGKSFDGSLDALGDETACPACEHTFQVAGADA